MTSVQVFTVDKYPYCIAACMGILCLSADVVLAQEVPADRGAALYVAGQNASSFSKESCGVGIVLSYGSFPGAPSADDIGAKFRDAFVERSIPSEYWVVYSANPGVSLSFVVGDVHYGPYRFDDAAQKFSYLVQMRSAANRLSNRCS